MAVSLSCARCRNFIKELKPNEIAKVTGEEICLECQEAVKKGFADVEAIRKKALGEINRIADKHLVVLDEMGRRAVKGGE